MRNQFPHIVEAFYGQPWAILPAKLAEIEAVLWRRIRGEGPALPIPAEQTASEPRPKPVRTEEGYTLLGSAAVVPISGTITPRSSVFAEWSGGSSAERIGQAVEAAVRDTKAEAIVLDVNSPGGYVAGIPEAAAKIAAAGKEKRIIAVANHLAASAAYWLASQASEIVVSPSAQVGSIGVLTAHVDETKLEEFAGVKTTMIGNTQSPYKTEGYPQVPLTAEGRADMQRTVDGLAQMFLDAVAKGRGIRSTTVERDFGQGRMKLAEEAVSVRMADRVATFEAVISEINSARSRRTTRRIQADLAALGLPTG